MGPFRKFSKTRIPEKSRKVTCLAIWKAFKDRQAFQQRPLDCTQIKTICHSNHQNTIRIWYFLWLIHMADVALWYKVDTKLRHVSQSYTNQFFSSSSFSCLPMKVCESEVYAKHIVQLWDMHCTCLFWNNFEYWYACSHQKISKATSYTWNQAIEWFQVT